MLVEVDGKLPRGVTAKDVVLAVIGKIGTAGGTGYAIEFGGSAIRALSMEGRMTVCNMAIEAGARAGMVAVDDTTIDYLRGRAFAPKGELWDRAVAYWRTLVSDPGAKFDRVVTLDAAAIKPQVTWGTSPEMVNTIDGARARSGADRRSAAAQGGGARAPLHGAAAEYADQRDPHRQGIHRLLYQLAHRGPARGRRGREGAARSRQRQARDGRAGFGAGEAAGRGGRARPGVQGRRLRVARAGLLDVPGHERRPPGAGRALRLHLQPQLRGPPGRGRTHASGEPGDGRGGGDCRSLRRRASEF